MTGFKKGIVMLIVLAFVVPAAFAAGAEEASGGMEDATLEVRFIGPADQADQDMVFEAVNAELANLLPGVQANFEIVGGADYADRWQLALSAGEQLDVAGRYWMNRLEQEVARGALTPLDDLIAEYGQDIQANLPAWVLDKGSVGGQVYEIPNYQIMTMMRYSFFAQKDVADAYGLQEIAATMEPKEFMEQEDWDLITEFLADAEAGGDLRSGPSVTAGWLAYKGFDSVGTDAVRYRFKDPNAELVNFFDTEEYRMGIAAAADWYERGWIREDILAMDDPRADDGPRPEGTIFYIHTYNYTDENGAAATTARWGFPWVNYSAVADNRVSYAPSNTNLAIPTTAEYPEQGMQFINLLNSEQGSDLFNMLTWGLEGRHYTVVREETADLPKRIETIGYAGQGNSDSAYGLWKWAMGNTAFSWLTQADQDDVIELWSDANATAVPSPLMGWIPDPAPIQTQTAQVNAVVAEYSAQLNTGVLGDEWEETYDEFLSALDAAGVDDIIAEYQSQIDEFLGN